MKIAFLTMANSLHIAIKTKYFVRNGHRVYYFGILPGGEKSAMFDDVTCIQIKSNKENRLFHLFDKLNQVRKLTRELDIDILHIIDMGYCLYAVFSAAKKTVLENNGSDVLVFPKQNSKLRFKYRFCYNFADAVVQDSKIAQEAGIKYGASVVNNEVIELGVDFDVFNLSVEKGIARERLDISDNQKFVFSPRGPRGITEIYNIDTIIESILLVRKKFENIKYVICTPDNNAKYKYINLVKKLNVEKNVVFVDYLDNDTEMPYFYADADVVLSVTSSDSSPRSVYEAMACGAPVIISELPWYHSKFKNGTDVLTVPVRNSEDLGKAIVNILSEKIVIEKEKIFQKSKELFDMNIHHKKLEMLYQKLLGL